jgi:AcrR family transcriptional regulator
VSSRPLGEPAPGDLTARARIRDAALRLFAERGIGGASIREIAAAAGVSSGLVRHHFGSKEELRDACDAYAMDRMKRMREQAFADGHFDGSFLSGMHEVSRVLQRYLLRSMLDGSPTAAAMFDDVVRQAEDWLLRADGVEIRDLRAAAVVLCVMQIGSYLMPAEVSRMLGVDIESNAGNIRVYRGLIDILGNALLTTNMRTELHAAIDGIAESPGTTGTEPEGAQQT